MQSWFALNTATGRVNVQQLNYQKRDKMEALYATYILVFTTAGIACLSGLIGVRRLKHPDVRRGLGGLLALSGVWALLKVLQLLLSSLTAKQAVYTGALVVGITTVFAWVYFASAYSGRQYHRNRLLRVTAVFILGAIVLLKVTNPFHGAYYEASLVTTPFQHAEVIHFAPHWFVTGFSYTVAGWGFWLLFDSFQDAESRPTMLYVLVTITALPIIPYVISAYTDLLLQINYEPLGVAVFALGVLFYARSEFTRLSSPGHSHIVDSISEGVLVVDDRDEVINYNDNVTTMLEERPTYRCSLAEFDEELATLSDDEPTILTRTVHGHTRRYEACRTDLNAPMSSAVITLTDVSAIAHIEEVTRLYQKVNEAIIDGSDPAVLEATIPKILAEVDAYRFVRLVTLEGQERDLVGGDPDGYLTEPGCENDPVQDAARTGRHQLVDVESASGEWCDAATERGIKACLAVPLPFPNENVRVLAVYTTVPEGFSPAEVTLLCDFADSIPHAVSAIRAHEEASEYQKAVFHAGYAIYVTDVDGTIRHVNPAFEEITGYAPEEAVGKTPRILKSGEQNESYYEELYETIHNGEVFEEEIINKTKSDDRYLARQTIAPVTDDEGAPVAFVAIQVDVTDQLLHEQRLMVLNRLLRHNLRNELNLISGGATLVEDVLESASTPAESHKTALEMIAEIQDVAETILERSEKAHEIENTLDRLQETSEPISLEAILESVDRWFTVFETSGRVTVADEVSECGVDSEVLMILEELVGNAIAHNDSPEPSVEVEVDLTVAGEVRFIVTDDGPGLSEQERSILDGGEETQLRHGSGLGLWMVNWLVVYSGGSVSAKTGDEGTTIEILVPARELPSNED